MKTIKGFLGSGLTVLMAAFMMVGCGKNSDNSQPVVPGYNNPYGYPQCNGCTTGQPGGVTVASSRNDSYGEMLQLQFTSQGQAQMYGQSSMVVAQGILIVGQYANSCGLPAGQYQVQSQPFQMQGNAAQNIILQGQGPVPVQIQIQRLYFTTPTSFQVNGYMSGMSGGYQACQIAYY